MGSKSEGYNADCPPNYEVTGDNNKMTSFESPKEVTDSSQLGLKKLAFEGEVIEIDDESDFERPVNSGDNIFTNDEMLSDDGCQNPQVYQGADPLDLLEQIDLNTSKNEINSDEEGESGDESNEGEANHLILSEIWQLRMKRWPWFLHQESDGDFAFCLYCNVSLNVCRNQKDLRQHNVSLYHQERTKNYLEFLGSDDYKQNFDQNHEVKYDFGTDQYVSAMKEKREREVEILSNYNWKRWLSSHSWLRRFQQEKTIGLCRYCNVRVNVEFTYLRMRHEHSKSHCEAKINHDNQSVSKGRKKQSTIETPKGNDTESAERWYEICDTDDKLLNCRCTLCDYRLPISSYNRHVTSKLHKTNLSKYNEKQKPIGRDIWARYAEQHPWLVSDPINPKVAYCNVCCRRFVYGHSEIRRKIHENSEHHLAGVAAAKSLLESGDKKEAEQTGMELSEEKNKGGKQDGYQLSTVKSNQKKCIVKMKKKVGQYSWLYSKDRKTRICKFCRVGFRNESSKMKHYNSSRHKKLVKQNKARQLARRKEGLRRRAENEKATKKEEESTEKKQKQQDKAEPTTMLGKVIAWKKLHPWVSYRRNELRDNYGWCNLCDASVFMPSIKYALNHQQSPRHRMRCQETSGIHGPYFTRARSRANLETDETKGKALDLSKQSEEVEETLSMEVDKDSGEESDSVTADPVPSKRRRIMSDESRLLRIFRDSVGGRNDERNHLDIAKDMISSSFDIVTQLRKLDRDNESQDRVKQTAAHTQPRDTMELFFESIVQTMKALPIDLAAEGKAKIMQIVSDLELRGIQRTASVAGGATDISVPKELQISTTTDSVANSISDQNVSKEILCLVSSSPDPKFSAITNAKAAQSPKPSSTVTSHQQPSEANKTNTTNGVGNEVPRGVRCFVVERDANSETNGNEVFRLMPVSNQNDRPQKMYALLSSANLGLQSGLSNITTAPPTKPNQVNRISNYNKFVSINSMHKQMTNNSGVIPVKLLEQGQNKNQTQIQAQAQSQQLAPKTNEGPFLAQAPLRELQQNKIQIQIQDKAPLRKTVTIQQNVQVLKEIPNKNQVHMPGQAKIRDQPNEKKQAHPQDTGSMPNRNQLQIRHPFVMNPSVPPTRK